MPSPFACLKPGSILHMGLHPITEREWVLPFSMEAFQVFSRHKKQVLTENPETILVDTQANAPLQELAALLSAHLCRHHAEAIASCRLAVRDIPSDGALSLLTRISQWLPDDICILQRPQGQSEYSLTAASVFSPSGWSPQEKFLQPLSRIHHRIPGYENRLSASVTRFFNHLRVNSPVERYNWSLQQGSALWRLPAGAISDSYKACVDHEPLYFRSERQSLLRLPDTEAVIFMIRTSLTRLDRLLADSTNTLSISGLLDIIDSLPEEQKSYKDLQRMRILLTERAGFS
ncbi:MAG: DUF3445 domain-containing protein [Pseudomonadales bacterium]|nr:DUF3445 domain-containing protein [Pseudomonadales bacterium]